MVAAGAGVEPNHRGKAKTTGDKRNKHRKHAAPT